MTEIEKKAEEYFSHHKYALHNRYGVQKDIHRMIYKDGYEQGLYDKHADREEDILHLEKENADKEQAIWKIHKIILNNLEDYCDNEEEKLLLLDVLGDMIKSVQSAK